MTATGYCSMLGHFFDSFTVQTCVFLFQSFHPAAHILPRYFLGTTEHFGTVTKSSKHANAIICNQQVVGSNPTAGLLVSERIADARIY